ncbi:MAG: sodium:calcium antiporter [Burkholderiales bacterium]|nr:sodium:calcium antiporter [Burkholderiales bacterium]
MTIAADDLLSLLSAIPLAALGGAIFVRGVVGVAQWLRLPEMLVATTLAAFATSSPEMAVSSLAAVGGKPGIGLGDALGSNVVNLGLILGLALMFGPLAARVDHFRRDFMLALVVPILTLCLALDGVLSRLDGVLLLALFALWLALVARQAMAHRRDGPPPADDAPVHATRPWLFVLGGMAALILAGQLFVAGASGIALELGVRPYVIGATLVAVGTSMPELVTVLLSRLRGHDDVGLGTVLGSNLFNGLAIVGTAATIHPIRTPLGELGAAVAFGVITLLLVVSRTGTVPRQRSVFLLAAYGGFVWLTATEALQR